MFMDQKTQLLHGNIFHVDLQIQQNHHQNSNWPLEEHTFSNIKLTYKVTLIQIR
jgi:copper(I)-binding protein